MSKLIESAWVGIVAVFTELFVPFITPISWYIGFMIAAIMADTVTGIIAAIKMRQTITSKGIWRTIQKIVIAGIAIMLSYGFELLFLPDFPLTKGVSAIISFAELKSNFENYHKITGVDIGTQLFESIKERIFNYQKPNADENQ